MKKVKIIVAVTENDAIGKNGKLLFSLKEDMKHGMTVPCTKLY